MSDELKTVKTAIITSYLANKLKDEEHLSKYFNTVLNLHHLKQQRHAKKLEIETDSKILLDCLKKTIKFKTSLIRILNETLGDDELFENNAFKFFSSFQDQLNEELLADLDNLRKKYEINVEEIIQEFDSERIGLEENFKEQFNKLEDVVICLEANFKADYESSIASHLKNLDLQKCEDQEQVMKLKLSRQNKLKTMVDKFNIINSLILKEKLKYEKSNEIMTKNLRTEREIARDKSKIKDLILKCKSIEDDLKNWKTKFASIEKRRKINELYLSYSDFFKSSNIQKKACKKKLVDLVNQSSSAKNKLKERFKKAEKILKFFQICSKLESKYDSLRPFCCNDSDASLTTNADNRISGDDEDIVISTILKNELSYDFQRKIAQVNMENSSLKLFNENLKKQNENLKTHLKKYFLNLAADCELKIG